jgi:hypothetical protein
MFLYHNFDRRCKLNFYYLTSILLKQRKFNDFMQMAHNETKNEEAMENLNQICENGSLSDREKIESVLHQNSTALLVAFAILTQSQRSKLLDLLKGNRILGLEKCNTEYERLIADRQDLSGTDKHTDKATEANASFDRTCLLSAYQVTTTLSLDNLTKIFIRRVQDQISHDTDDERIFDIINRSRLSNNEKVQLLLSKIPSAGDIAFCMLTPKENLELHNLFNYYRSKLSPERRVQAYCEDASPTRGFRQLYRQLQYTEIPEPHQSQTQHDDI